MDSYVYLSSSKTHVVPATYGFAPPGSVSVPPAAAPAPALPGCPAGPAAAGGGAGRMVAPPCSCSAIIISAALVISAISHSIATGDSPGRRSRMSLAVEEEVAELEEVAEEVS